VLYVFLWKEKFTIDIEFKYDEDKLLVKVNDILLRSLIVWNIKLFEKLFV
jgi:hypothetical protein